MKHSLLTATAIGLFLANGIYAPAHADAETDALRQQIKLLEARLDQLEKRETSRNAAAVSRLEPSAGPVNKRVEDRVNILERKLELAEEDAKTKSEKTPTVEVGLGKGLTVTSPDKQFAFKLKGFAQADTRTFFDNSNTSNVDQFLIRSARPTLEAKLTDWFSARLTYDVSANTLPDAYVDGKFDPLFNVRIGKFKLPLGLERWQSEQELITVERGLTTSLVPDRDIGVMAFGQIVPDRLEYQLAFTNGSGDLVNGTGDLDDNKDVVGRLFAHPFRNSYDSFLQGLGIGLAGSYGNHIGNSTTSNLTAGYRTPAQASFFTYQTGTFADGTKYRINPQAYYYRGPLSILGEYIVNSEEVRRTTTHTTLDHTGWFAATTYVLTGEDASFEGVKPAKNFDLKNGDWGAFEVVGRYGELDIDNAAFPLYATSTASASQANEAIIGLNWYFNPALKLQTDFAWTTFKGGNSGNVDRESEKVLRTRTQFKF